MLFRSYYWWSWIRKVFFSFHKCSFFSSHIEGWNFLWGLADPSLVRLFLLILHLRRISTPCKNINGWDMSFLYSNHLNILSRSTISFLYLGYKLWAFLNHMIDCSAILTCHSWVLTVSRYMHCLITVIENNLASTSSRHTTTTTTSKTTSTRCITMVTISIISLCIRVDPISVVGSFPHKVEAATFIFIVAYWL